MVSVDHHHHVDEQLQHRASSSHHPKKQQNITITPGKGRDQGGGWIDTELDLKYKGLFQYFFPFQERKDCEKVT